MRVLLADDHALVRAGIRALLAALPEVESVTEAGDGQQALALLLETRPDVALIDIGMPGLNGLELAARVTREAPGTRLVIVSMHGTPGHVAQALRAGVSGYVLKDAAAEELPVLLRAVMRGETYLSPAISKHVVDGYLGRTPPPGRLSGRERHPHRHPPRRRRR
jgi:DNA-binding NarL/FixJ family response regulator